MTLAQHLKDASKWICEANECTEDNHNCESYAYITKDMECLDICTSDFFQGTSQPYAAIALPWDGTQEELEEEVLDQCAEMEDN